MATLQEELANLRALKASGTLSVTHDGRRVEYRSMAEINIAIADLEAKIAAASGARRPIARRTTFRRSGR
jgi:ribosomal protein L29